MATTREDDHHSHASGHCGRWHTTASRYLFTSPWYSVRQDEVTLPQGQSITYTHIEHPGYVMVVPLLDDGQVVMERVYRHTVQRYVLECPAGGRENDSPTSAALRELEEETGYRAAKLDHLGRFLGSTGISNEAFDLFLARGLTPDGTLAREVTEQMEVITLPFDAAYQQAIAGEIEDAPSTLGLLLAHVHLLSEVK